ncbi:hypothetical protein Tco_0817851 [Tanacetum coccineum]
METKDTVSSCSVSQEQEIQRLQEKARLSKEGCMKGLKTLQSHFTSLSENLKDNAQVATFKRTFTQDMDLLEKQLTKEILHEIDCKTALTELRTIIKVKQFKDTLLQHMGNVKKFVAERKRHKRQYDRRVNKRQMQTQESKTDMGKAMDVDLVVTKSSGTESEVQDESSRSGNDADTDDADIIPINDEEPMAKVQLTIECNVFATGKQHTATEINSESVVAEKAGISKTSVEVDSKLE